MDENNKDLNPNETPEENVQETPETEEKTVEESVPEVPNAPEAAPKASLLDSVKKLFAGKKPITIAAVAGVLLVAIIAIVALTSGSPLGLVKEGIENTAVSLGENPVFALMSDIAKGGSVEAAMDLEELTGIDGSASVKFYSSDKPAFGLVASADLDGEDVDATIVLNEKELAVASDVLFGDKAYGIKFDKIADRFEDSIFGPDGEFSLGIEKEDLDEIFNASDDSEKMAKEATAIIEDLAAAAIKSIQKHAEIEKGKETIDFADVSCKTTTVTITVDALTMVEIADDMLQYVNEDKAIRVFLTDNLETISKAMESRGYDEIDADNFIEDFYDSVADALEGIEDIKENAEDADVEIEIVFYISNSGKYLVGTEIKVDAAGEKVKMELFAGPTLKELSEISFRYSDDYDDVKGSYTVEVNDKKEYDAEFKVKYDNETVLDGSVKWDK